MKNDFLLDQLIYSVSKCNHYNVNANKDKLPGRKPPKVNSIALQIEELSCV